MRCCAVVMEKELMGNVYAVWGGHRAVLYSTFKEHRGGLGWVA